MHMDLNQTIYKLNCKYQLEQQRLQQLHSKITEIINYRHPTNPTILTNINLHNTAIITEKFVFYVVTHSLNNLNSFPRKISKIIQKKENIILISWWYISFNEA